ncbi:MAG: TIGR04150 pseudo-rSAM protein [bacterium]|nr:TIGR04150 pseudo-rSAM protein [bacterium]
MNNKKKNYWFTIETYVHIALKKDSLLLYNSLTGQALEYPGQGKILNLGKRLLSSKNLLVIKLGEKELSDPVIAGFVSDVRAGFMGDLIDVSYSNRKPVQMMPRVKVLKDIDKLKENSVRSVGEGVMDYLAEISLYITNLCGQNCGFCNSAYTQITCCTGGERKKRQLQLSRIINLIPNQAASSIDNINILGGDIFMYSELDGLVAFLNSLPVRKTYYAHYLHIINNVDKLELLSAEQSAIKILVPPATELSALKRTLEIIRNSSLTSKFVFILQGESEFERAEQLILNLNIGDCEYLPFYNGENLDFFKENVFTSIEDILESKPRLKDIYINTAVNKLDFGALTVLSSGGIHANVNRPRLGVLGKNTLYEVLFKELAEGKSWRRVRKNATPCKSCTFEALCPPLSNYNYAFGKSNLCDRGI